ncbi:MAG: hypothetical protein JSS69_05740 [Acidobacteria bacterium]|nr:hypothetical protein [Acidobacteriota bacterium]MBS1865403.1 hypothetical protein [Acidobacteriota bacterium]
MALLAVVRSAAAQTPAAPAPSGARILLVPRRMISGERATIAVLDVGGRLTPGVTIQFSNGDKVTTDTTGRALFVAPLTTGALYASIEGRPGRVATAILPAPSAASAPRIDLAPRVASATDRFEMTGAGFCGDADKNRVTIEGQPALVLASSPNALTILPPLVPPTGLAEISVACGKEEAASIKILFVLLKLEADTSSMQPGQKRTLKVSIGGTEERVQLEARNLTPDVADLEGGNPSRVVSSGGEANSAEFNVTGKKHGSFLISIRLVHTMAKPRR